MDELIGINQQRRAALKQIRSDPQSYPKFQVIEEQRKRMDRQNWIIRVIKSVKLFNVAHKKAIFDTTVKMMNFYQPISAQIKQFQEINYLQTIINLFVSFYNMFQNVDHSHIKAIVRPNNTYIIIDLIKSLVDMGRKEFRDAIGDIYRPPTPIKLVKKKLSQSLIALPKNKQSKQQVQEKIIKKQQKFGLFTKLNYVKYEKNNRFIDNFHWEEYQQKINQVYFDLLYLNQKNSGKIQKYLDGCLGPKRMITYDISGLYTQQQLRQMQNNRKQKLKLKMQEVKELSGQVSAEQLKQNFKMKLEQYDRSVSVPIFNTIPTVNSWFPVVLMKSGDKLHPFNMCLEHNGICYKILEFEQRMKKRYKIYLKQNLAKNMHLDVHERIVLDRQMLSFNKRQFIDFNHQKVNQILMKQIIIPVVKKQKQLILPIINQIQEPLRKKVKSQTKLPNVMILSSKTQVQKTIDKRLNYSSFVKQIGVGPRRKMDTLIDSILRSRQYTHI